MTIWDYLIQDIPKEQIFETEESVVIYLAYGWDKKEWASVSIKDMGYEYDHGDVVIMTDYVGDEMSDIIEIPNEYVKRMKNCTIDLPKDSLLSQNVPFVRRPFYMVRGKTITAKQVKEILKGELPMFRNKDFFDDRAPDLNTCVLGKIIPDRHGSSGGWLWDTGEIGGNRWSAIKDPEFGEFMPYWIRMALKYPFLDMVIGYTNYDELPCYDCSVSQYYEYKKAADLYKSVGDENSWREYEELCREEQQRMDQCYVGRFPCRREKIPECEAHFKKRKDPWWMTDKHIEDFDGNYMWIVDVPQIREDVILTVRIKDGHIDVTVGDEARAVFTEYDKKYHFKDPYRYSVWAIDYFKRALIGEKMLTECMEECGMDVEESMEFLVKHGLEREYMG